MKKTTGIVLGIIGIFGILTLWFIGIHNNLVRKEESVNSAWAQVENVYQRRLDLIPNLVTTVKGYAKHEKETLQAVIQARSAATQMQVNVTDAQRLQEFQKNQDALSSALGRLMVVAERYPELKANENFKELQAQLEGTENRIAVERRRFNEVAQEYNTSLRVFPASLIAKLQGFQSRAYFQAQQGSEKAPTVQFD